MSDPTPLLQALRDLDRGECETFWHPQGGHYNCFDYGRIARAAQGADQACPPCIAHRALEQYEAGVEAEPPHPDAVPRIVTEGDVLVQTVNGWVIIERVGPLAGWSPLRGPGRDTITIDEITRTAEALHARGSLPDNIEWRPWWPTFTTVAEEPWTPNVGDRVHHTTDKDLGPGTVRSRSATFADIAWDNGMWSNTAIRLLAPVFPPPDMGTRECPQPWKPGWGLDDFAVRLGHAWIENSRLQLYCLRCNRPASGTTIHAGTLLSWLVDIAIEHSHDCESR